MKLNWFWGFMGFFGIFGYLMNEPLYYAFFVFFLFFLSPALGKKKGKAVVETAAADKPVKKGKK